MPYSSYHTPKNPRWLRRAERQVFSVCRGIFHERHFNKAVRRLCRAWAGPGGRWWWFRDDAAYALVNLNNRRVDRVLNRVHLAARLRPRSASPRPRPPRPTPAPPRPSAPGQGTASPTAQAEAPPGEQESSDGDGDPASRLWLHLKQAHAATGRLPRRWPFRRCRLTWPKNVWKGRFEQFLTLSQASNAVAFTVAIQGRPDPLGAAMRLVAPAESSAFRKLAEKLAAHKAHFALRLGTRNERGGWYPHAHGVVLGLTPGELGELAKSAGVVLADARHVENPGAWSRYVMGRAQAHDSDRSTGPTWFTAVNTSAPPAPKPTTFEKVKVALERLLHNPPTGPVTLAPGVRVVDSRRFLESTLAQLEGPPSRIRDVALEHAITFLNALSPPPGGGP